MKQATQPGFYTGDDGVDVFVPAGAVRSDSHVDVQRLPLNWRDIPEEETGPPAAPAPAARKPAAKGM